MKQFSVILFLVFSASLLAQSPYYSIKFKMEENAGSEFTIHSKTCRFRYEPVVPSGDYWFGRDTSQLDWNNLPDSMYKKIECRTYDAKNFINDGDQAMVWENIYRYDIIRNQTDTMTIVFPILIKSFITMVDLGTVQFKKGYFELIDEFTYREDKNAVKLSMPGEYNWTVTDIENRKIKINN